MTEGADNQRKRDDTRATGEQSRWIERGVLGLMCALVVSVYAYTAHEGAVTQPSDDASGSYYNLLAQGFRAGQLNLKREAPPELAKLADPYAPNPLRPPGVMDLSYYNGKLYLYFGVTPAVVLFWPFVAATGYYLFYRQAMTIFCAVGFLASVGILWGAWRRHFAEVSVWVVAAGVLALGLATFMPSLMARCEVWEVPISCGYMLTMLALAAIWKAVHEPESRKRSGWLAGASVAYGLAVGARPSLLLGAVMLWVPVLQTWRERRPIWLSVFAVIVPITLIGFGLMLYNVQRFDDPFEFGIHYQMTVRSQIHEQLFSVHDFWLHLRAYFLEPARWSHRFPFVHRAGDAFGVLTCVPLAWLALAAPLAWRGRASPAASALHWFVIAVALLFGMCALTLGLYCFVAVRYEAEFLPALVLLAVIGMLSLERALIRQPLGRRVVRWGYGLVLGFSVAFSVLASVEGCAEADNDLGIQLRGAGRVEEAIGEYEQALHLNPDFADAHINLGIALMHAGRTQEAIGHYEQAVRIRPDFAKGHNELGIALARQGRVQEAIRQWEQALQLKPVYFEARNNLGNALLQSGRIPEAIEQYEQALRINPDFALAHHNLGVALVEAGKVGEAIGQFEQAVRLDPGFVRAHNQLGNALMQTGRIQEAIAQFEQALRMEPGYADAHYGLANALLQEGRIAEATGHLEEALRIKPDFTQAREALRRLQARR